MNKFFGPQELIAQVPIKIAFQIAKRGYSLTAAEDFFARAADPNSETLQTAVGSRCTVTRKLEDIVIRYCDKVIKPK